MARKNLDDNDTEIAPKKGGFGPIDAALCTFKKR